MAPVHDAWGTKLRYIATSDRNACMVASAGADGRFDETTSSIDAQGVDFAEDAALSNDAVTRSWACR